MYIIKNWRGEKESKSVGPGAGMGFWELQLQAVWELGSCKGASGKSAMDDEFVFQASRIRTEMSFKSTFGASLVAQWLRIRLPMQGTWVRALVWEDPTCRRAARPVSHNYWACASGTCAPQWERPRQWEARAPRWRVAPARRNWRKPSHRNEDPSQPKINK